jgi:hypothetical protein
MDPAYISALSALFGSAIAASASERIIETYCTPEIRRMLSGRTAR